MDWSQIMLPSCSASLYINPQSEAADSSPNYGHTSSIPVNRTPMMTISCGIHVIKSKLLTNVIWKYYNSMCRNSCLRKVWDKEEDHGGAVYNKKTCIKEGEGKTVKMIRVLRFTAICTSQQGFNSCRSIDFRDIVCSAGHSIYPDRQKLNKVNSAGDW